MRTILGIDLGTSNIKAMLLDVENGVAAVESRGYDVEIPETGRAEQNPEVWWNALLEILSRLKSGHQEAYEGIGAVGLSGQMHGLVAVDREGRAVRPAILWLDQRSEEEVGRINGILGEQEKREVLHNRIYTGFAFPSLLWFQAHEPELYKKTWKIMQPKDFIRLKLTGCFGTDVSDASATVMFDLKKRDWAWEIVGKFGIREDLLAACKESMDIAGCVTEECALISGLKKGIPVIYGCGDQMAQSVGNGVVEEGSMISNIGTGGQISAYSVEDIYDRELRTHTFCHAFNRAYSVYGATLCCGLSLKWLSGGILGIDDFKVCNELAAGAEAGSDGLIYLPYLSGERTPIMNPRAKGMFFGLKLEHDKRHLIRAVMEGVIFSLKDSLLLLEGMGIKGTRMIASGGGASSPLFLQMQADVFEREIEVSQVKEQACLGACILAGVGTGVFSDVESACRRFAVIGSRRYQPDSGNRIVYEENYERYHQLYRCTRDLMDRK